LNIGYFGASTGAAAALVAASERPNVISAIVSRGGRPDLAGQQVLNRIQAPTLLIVGENDKQVIHLNENALKQLSRLEKKKKIVIIPGATHLFEEPGTLEEVARRASGWFECFFLEKRKDIGRH
jgi:pimeloyl-ACP methyl ester carboxylesterase